MKLYVIAGRGGGVQETSIRPFGQWELLSIHNISSVASEPERAAEARSAVVASLSNENWPKNGLANLEVHCPSFRQPIEGSFSANFARKRRFQRPISSGFFFDDFSAIPSQYLPKFWARGQKIC